MDGGRGAPESLAGADFIHATGEAKPGATPLATATSFSGPAEASGARFAFAEDGAIGAFLVAGPFEHGRLPDDASLIPRRDQSLGAAGGGARWRSVAATDGVLDVIGSLDAGVRGNVAYAGGVVHVEHSGRHVFLVGVDDAGRELGRRNLGKAKKKQRGCDPGPSTLRRLPVRAR